MGALVGVGTNLIEGDQWGNVASGLSYRGTGGIKSMNYGNGRRLRMSYDANRQQPVGMTVDRQDGSDRIVDYAYQYYDGEGRNNGRIRRIVDNYAPAYTTEHQYDRYDRLTGAQAGTYGNYTWTRSYAHDPWGNITYLSGLTQNYETNQSGAPATNRVVSDSSGASFGYDQAGNMTSAPGWTYGYDGANRLATATGPGGTSGYGYDGDGARVKQAANGGEAVYYVRSSVVGQAVLEVGATQGVRRAYLQAGGKLLAEMAPDGRIYWLHTNHLNSASRMTDRNGAMVYRGEYDPYGNMVYEWGSAGLNTRKFTGYERDGNTGLDYANARMYGPGRGRFMQPDPIGLKGVDFTNPQSLNRYSYAFNDPVNLVDPSGLFPELPASIMWGLYGLTVVGRIATNEPFQYSGSGSGVDGMFLPEEEGLDVDISGLVGINEAEILNRAINSVKDRLNTRSECKDLYGDLDVDDYLANRISISNKDQNGNPFKSEKVYGSTGKDQYGNVTTIFNQNSSVFTGMQAGLSMDAMLSQLPSDIRDKIGLKYIDSLAKFQELNVLHELLHAADRDGRKYFDTGNEQKTIANDRVIGELCFK